MTLEQLCIEQENIITPIRERIEDVFSICLIVSNFCGSSLMEGIVFTFFHKGSESSIISEITD